MVLAALFLVGLAGCIGDPDPTPGTPVPPEPAFTMEVGDRIVLQTIGTGWFRAAVAPQGHLNLRLLVHHPDVQDWCRNHDRYPDNAYTTAVMYRDEPFYRHGSGVLRWSTEDHQSTRHMGMMRQSDCHRGEVFVARTDEPWTLLIASTLPGLVVTVEELRAGEAARHEEVRLSPHPELTLIEPILAVEGGHATAAGRVVHARTWQHEVQAGPIWVWALEWRRVDAPVPPSGVHVDDWWFSIETDGQTHPEPPYDFAGGQRGGGSWNGAHMTERATPHQGNHTISWTHEETAVGPWSYHEGIRFLIVPLTHA